MSKSQRTKGAAFERECVILLNEYGADAERNLSQTRDGGYDIDSLFGAFECKKRAAIPSYLRPVENVRGVVFAQDRGERLVLLRFKDACELMQGALARVRVTATREPYPVRGASPDGEGE